MLTYVWIVSWIQTAVRASIVVAVASILGIYTIGIYNRLRTAKVKLAVIVKVASAELELKLSAKFIEVLG